MATTKKKMGSIGKLSQFSGIKPVQVTEPVTESPVSSVSKENIEEKSVPINIKITKSQKNWLTETAQQVRDNNTEPVPPNDRVYPQHLIGIAIDLLKSSEVDWAGVKTVEDLRQLLKL